MFRFRISRNIFLRPYQLLLFLLTGSILPILIRKNGSSLYYVEATSAVNVGTSNIQPDGTVIIDNNNYNYNDDNNNNNNFVEHDTRRHYYRKDPNLKKMPNYNFEAYIRPDIATFYQQELGTLQEIPPSFQGLAGKFINLSPKVTSLYWVGFDGKAILNGDVPPWGAGGTATFVTHKFILTEQNQPKNIICTFTVEPKISVYYCDPYQNITTAYTYSRPGVLEKSKQQQESLISLTTEQMEYYNTHIENLNFGDAYQNFTNGSPWLTLYPPLPATIHIWPADYFGQIHTITTNETQFHTMIPEDDDTIKSLDRRLTIQDMKYPSTSYPTLQNYRDDGLLNLSLKVVSCMPRAFEIDNFLSDTEVDHILNIVKESQLQRSSTNGHISTTRTSRNTWIPRQTDPIINAIHRRAADVLQIDEALLRSRTDQDDTKYKHLETKGKYSEDLQVVHYSIGQQYTAHHDFGYPKGMMPVHKLDRYLNLAMYLNDVDSGGSTSFPRYRNAEFTGSLHVQPKRGKALLFYMTMPDGNFDDMSQHAGSPVHKGEKYFINLWVRSYL